MPTTDNDMQTQQITDRHDQYMSINYGRFPIAIVRGEGSFLFDANNKRYIDLFAGFGAGVLGHCHPDLVSAIHEQAQKLWHVGNLFHTEPQTRAAEAISKHAFEGRSYFCHSGADANVSALKLARLYGQKNKGKTTGGRYKVISTLGSFHGRSFGAMEATGQPKVYEGFGPLGPRSRARQVQRCQRGSKPRSMMRLSPYSSNRSRVRAASMSPTIHTSPTSAPCAMSATWS